MCGCTGCRCVTCECTGELMCRCVNVLGCWCADVLVSGCAVCGCARGRAGVQVCGCTSVRVRGCARARVCACAGVHPGCAGAGVLVCCVARRFFCSGFFCDSSLGVFVLREARFALQPSGGNQVDDLPPAPSQVDGAPGHLSPCADCHL